MSQGREDAKRKHISGLHAARAADEFARREPVKWVSSAQEEGKQVVALTPAPVIGAKKAPPRLSKASRRDDAIVAPPIGLEEHKAALRQVFGETLSDEFVDVMLTKLVSVLRPGLLEGLDEATLNAAIALIASVQPRSELQAVIAVQIAATAFAGLKFLQSGQRHLEEAYIRIDGGFANRLLRLKLELIQALDKHRRVRRSPRSAGRPDRKFGWAIHVIDELRLLGPPPTNKPQRQLAREVVAAVGSRYRASISLRTAQRAVERASKRRSART